MISTSSGLLHAFEQVKVHLELPETEETWERINSSLQALVEICRTEAPLHPAELASCIRSVHRNISSAMASERTRLSGAAMDVVNILASELNTDFEPLLPIFLPGLLTLCGRPNKVVLSRAKACILTIIESTQLPSILSHLLHFAKEKSPTIRLAVAEGTLACLKSLNPPDLEKESRSREVESILRVVVKDPNADVRKAGKEIFQSYKLVLPHRVQTFAAPLTPTVRKYLQVESTAIGTTKSTQRRPIATTTTTRSTTTSTSKPAIAPTTSKPTVASGPSRAVSITLSKQQKAPSALSRPVSKGRTLDGSVGGSSLKLAPKPPQRPMAPKIPFTNTRSTGPQRATVKLPSQSQSSLPTVKRPLLTGKKPTHERSTSTDSTAPSARRNVPTRSLPQKANTVAGPSRVTRDITRPTLSQLARTKAPTSKATQPTEKLTIRKMGGGSLNPPPPAAARVPPQAKTQTNKCENASTLPIINEPQIAPAAVPLPPSPEPSREPSPKPVPETQITDFGTSTPAGNNGMNNNNNIFCKTPISALLSSIQQGFDMTPCSPLSPAQHYIRTQDSSPCDPTQFRLGGFQVPRQNPTSVSVVPAQE